MRYSLLIMITLILVSPLFAAPFDDVSNVAGVTQRDTPVDIDSGTWLGPGTAAVDYNNDSCWMDIFVIGDGGLPNALYHNNGDDTLLKNNVNPDNKRIKIRLRGVESNRDGIGARVELK